LLEAQEAAARVAAGAPSDDASRESRARNSHWAPQVRAQGGAKSDAMSRTGQRYNAPLVESDIGAGQSWSVQVAWDFSQVVFAREETQLALAHAHLSRLRREARDRAAQLFLDRQHALRRWQSGSGPQRQEACVSALNLTAQLDSITGGLFRDALTSQEASCVQEENKQ
jgi:hypothetical protein